MEQKEYNRICPNCPKILKYKSYISWWQANKKNNICRSCRGIERANRPGEKLRRSKVMKGRFDGDKNPFYGKTHSARAKQKIKDNTPKQLGMQNKMFGKTVYDVWLKKYGKEEADKKDLIRKAKWSKASSGKNNSMYGKPSPQGSGVGWKGWYKGFFFRSLRELSYVIKVLEHNKCKWVTGESKKLEIKYVCPLGHDRTYRPDFFVEGTRLIECKPIKLHQSPSVQAKAKAGKIFAKERGWTYELIDPILLSNIEIQDLYNSGQIKFTERYEMMYKEKYVKN